MLIFPSFEKSREKRSGMQLSDFRIGRSSRNRNETQQKKNAPRGESDGGARAQFFFFDFRESHFLLDLENDRSFDIER